MGRIVAIGGGIFEEIDSLIGKAVELSQKDIPNVLFIGTAAEDSTNPLTSCKKAFKRVCPGCIVKKLSIIRTHYEESEIDELFSWADVIFVGPGNTRFMLEKWKEFGIDERLLNAFREDSAVLSGVSAGAICWFSLGYTDSQMFDGKEEWSFEWIRPRTAVIDAAFTAHYNLEGRASFDEAYLELYREGFGGDPDAQKVSDGKDGVQETKQVYGLKAFALEDGTALLYDQGNITFLRSIDGMHGYEWHIEGNMPVKEER